MAPRILPTLFAVKTILALDLRRLAIAGGMACCTPTACPNILMVLSSSGQIRVISSQFLSPEKPAVLGANLSAPVKASLSGDVHPRGAVFLQPESRRIISPIAGAQNLPVSVPTGVSSDEKNYDPDCA
jgi:hypothetical protein